MQKNFIKYLKERGFSDNTVNAYILSIKIYEKMYIMYNHKNILAFKSYLIAKYKPKTVNLRLQGLNVYLGFIGKNKLKISQLKIQQKSYLENVISNEDYEFLKKSLLSDNNYKWYFVIRFLAATGARVSELLKFKYEHVLAGYIDIYSKGGKIRRIFIPLALREEYIKYADNVGMSSGYLFLNNRSSVITSRGIAIQLKKMAKKYGIDEKVLYPHSFRHRFAKNFIEKYNDIALLADLMGHDSIETTRIYLRKTMLEQKNIVDAYVIW